jgi:hypothetical protein
MAIKTATQELSMIQTVPEEQCVDGSYEQVEPAQQYPCDPMAWSYTQMGPAQQVPCHPMAAWLCMTNPYGGLAAEFLKKSNSHEAQQLPESKRPARGKRKGKSLITLAAEELQRKKELQQQRRPQPTQNQPQQLMQQVVVEAHQNADALQVPQQQNERKFCPYCGGAIRAQQTFCQFCGQNMSRVFGAAKDDV